MEKEFEIFESPSLAIMLWKGNKKKIPMTRKPEVKLRLGQRRDGNTSRDDCVQYLYACILKFPWMARHPEVRIV
jgi:hypothetical protein